MRDNVVRVRRLLSEATAPKRSDSAETLALRAFQHDEFNTLQAPLLEQSPQARALRDITRIVTWYGWGGEIERALDAAGVASMAGLSWEQLETLQVRMARLEHCAQEGLDPPDSPPAR